MAVTKKEELLKFQQIIEELVVEKDISYLEAITIFCEEQDFEVEKIPRMISNNMLSKIETEATNLSLIKSDKNIKKLNA